MALTLVDTSRSLEFNTSPLGWRSQVLSYRTLCAIARSARNRRLVVRIRARLALRQVSSEGYASCELPTC